MNPIVDLISALGATPLSALATWMPSIIAAAALLAAILPPVAADSPWAPARRMLDVLAVNIGHAINAPVAPPIAPAPGPAAALVNAATNPPA